jgi:hypothetical protein
MQQILFLYYTNASEFRHFKKKTKHYWQWKWISGDDRQEYRGKTTSEVT